MKKHLTTFSDHLTERHATIGTEKRTNFEIKAKAFAIGEIIRDARKEANMTQEQLADRTGTKKVSFQELRMDIVTSNFLPFID